MDTSNKGKWFGMGLLLAILGAGFFWVTRGGDVVEDEPMGIERESGPDMQASAGEVAGVTLVSVQDTSQATSGQRAVVKQSSVAEQAIFAPRKLGKSVIWIDGIVESVEGTPLDESMQVVAKGKVFRGTKNRREHRVPVAADGRFRVAIAVDTAAARLSLIAKYQYLKDPEVWVKSKGGEAVLKPKLGAHVTVQVVTEALTTGPIPDCKATLQSLWGWDGDTSPALLEGNRFELRAVPAGRDFRLIVKTSGYASSSIAFKELDPGSSKEESMVLIPEAVIRGRLVDSKGEPVPGGRVAPRLVGEQRWGSSLGMNSQVDVQEGQFEVRGMPAGDIELHYSGSGFSAEALTVPGLRAGEQRTGLVWRANKGLSVRGKVIWPDGSPARHVSVKLVGMSQRELAAAMGDGGFSESLGSKTETDAEGFFEISGFSKAIQVELMAEGLPPNKAVPRDLSKIQARRYRRKNTVRARVDKVLVGGRDLSILLGEPQEPLHGRVEDDLGQPIKNFRLVVTPLQGKTVKKQKKGWGRTKGGSLRQRYQDEDGHFEWSGIPGGNWSVEATAPGYQKGEVLPVTLPSTKDVVLMLPRGARIFGKVVDQEGDKVLAEVRYALQVGGEVSDNEDSVAATKQFGFSIGNLAPGTYSVYANEPKAGSSPSQVFEVGAGDVVKDVVLQLPGPGRLEGSVHRDWGGAGLTVKLRPERSASTHWGRSQSGKVKAGGTFAFAELAPGKYTARLQANFETTGGHGVTSDPGQQRGFEIVSGQTTQVHFAGAPAGSVRLKGRLLRDGKGVPGYQLEFTGLEPKQGDVECISRKGGSYSMILPGAGSYRIRARAPGGEDPQIWQIDVGSGGVQNVDLVLPSYSLVVMLEAQGGGVLPFEPMKSDLTIRGVGMRSNDSISAESVTDQQAIFTGLAAGTYRLKFESRAWGRRDRGIDSASNWVLADPADIVLQPGESQKTVHVELRRGGILTGLVNDFPADPGMWTYVSVALSEDGSPIKWGEVEEGRFSVVGLPAGDVWLTCDGSGLRRSEPVSVTIHYESPAYLEIPYPQEDED